MVESDEINGARKLLLKLEQEFSMSIVPAVEKFYVGQDVEKQGSKDWFPIDTKYRKLAGEGMMRWLLESKDNVRRWLYEDCQLLAFYERDKNGKVVRINIKAE